MGDDSWDDEAERFDDEPDHGLHDLATRAAWRSLLLEHLPTPPARVADLGCGTGTLTLLLAEAGFDVDGVDRSRGMLARARAKLAGRGEVSLVEGDAATPPLDPSAYDAVLCRHLLWALPDPAAALVRWVGLLRPAGRLILVEGTWHTGAGLTADRTAGLVRGAGLTTVVRRLDGEDDAVLWGGPVTDQRYLVDARRAGGPGSGQGLATSA